MKMKNDCERDYIKEAFDKLYTRVMPYIDLTQFADARTAFQELDKKVHSEIYILKKCLAESDRAVDAGLTRSKVLQERISDLEQRLNDECKHGEDLADINGQLASENADLRVTPPDANAIETLEKENSELRNDNKALANTVEQYKKSFLVRCKERERLREVINGKEKEINTLKKKIQDLEEENASLNEDVDALVAENADLHERLSSCEKSIETLKKSNGILRRDNEALWARLKGRDLDIYKRPWHGDANARTCHKSLVETVEELEAEKKARLEEKVDLSYGHDFKFGDEVFVPWSCEPYMYVIRGRLYNPRTENLVYVSGTEHLKWFGDKFSIV